MRVGELPVRKNKYSQNSNRVDINCHWFNHACHVPEKDAHLHLPRLGIGPDGSEIRESRVFRSETEFECAWLKPWMLEDHELGLVGVSSTGTLEFRTVYEEYGIRISAFRLVIYQITQSRLPEWYCVARSVSTTAMSRSRDSLESCFKISGSSST